MLKFSKTNKSVLLDERLMGEGGGAPAPCAPPLDMAHLDSNYTQLKNVKITCPRSKCIQPVADPGGEHRGPVPPLHP